MSEHINKEIPKTADSQLVNSQIPRPIPKRDPDSLLDQIRSESDSRRAELLAEEFKRQMINDILKKHAAD